MDLLIAKQKKYSTRLMLSITNKIKENTGLNIKIKVKISPDSIFSLYKNSFLTGRTYEFITSVRESISLKEDFQLFQLIDEVNKIKNRMYSYFNIYNSVFGSTFLKNNEINCVSSSMLFYLLLKERVKTRGVLVFLDKNESFLRKGEFHFMLAVGKNPFFIETLNPFEIGLKKYLVLDVKYAFYYAVMSNVIDSLLKSNEKLFLYQFLEDDIGLFAYSIFSATKNPPMFIVKKAHKFFEKFLKGSKKYREEERRLEAHLKNLKG